MCVDLVVCMRSVGVCVNVVSSLAIFIHWAASVELASTLELKVEAFVMNEKSC